MKPTPNKEHDDVSSQTPASHFVVGLITGVFLDMQSRGEFVTKLEMTGQKGVPEQIDLIFGESCVRVRVEARPDRAKRRARPRSARNSS
jgi:hypothetical protein